MVEQAHRALDVLEQSLRAFATAGFHVDIDSVIHRTTMTIKNACVLET